MDCCQQPSQSGARPRLARPLSCPPREGLQGLHFDAFMLIMKDVAADKALEARLVSARIIDQIKVILAALPPRSVEANQLIRLNWRVEATAKAVITQGASLEGEIGRLQQAFILRKGDLASPQLSLPEALSKDIDSLSQLAEEILSDLDEAH